MKATGKKAACGKAGKIIPEVNLNRCSGKGDCAAACPFGVFTLQPIRPEDTAGLTWVGRLKTWFKVDKAYALNAPDCHACGICVTVCPEKAIQLRPV